MAKITVPKMANLTGGFLNTIIITTHLPQQLFDAWISDQGPVYQSRNVDVFKNLEFARHSDFRHAGTISEPLEGLVP